MVRIYKQSVYSINYLCYYVIACFDGWVGVCRHRSRLLQKQTQQRIIAIAIQKPEDTLKYN